MQNIFIVIFICASLVCNSQSKTTKKAPVNDPKKHGYCKVTAVEEHAKFHENNAMVVISFVAPNNQPHKTGVRFKYNNDSLVPKLDNDGKYTMRMDPGKYKMQFFVPYWHKIVSDSIVIRGKHITRIQVNFQPEEMGGGH